MSKTAFLFIGLFFGIIASAIVFYLLKPEAIGIDNKAQTEVIDTVYVKADTVIQKEIVIETVEIASPDTVIVHTQFELNKALADMSDTNDYVVLRDKMLDSKTVPILNIDNNKKMDAADVLVQKMSNDEAFSESIHVEFWESPIGYEGYRLNKTKLVLFGVNPKDELSLTFVKQGYLLLHLGALKTKIYPTENFLTFEN